MSSDPIAPPVADTPERRAFYDRISRQNLTPLWLSLANLVTPEPVSALLSRRRGRSPTSARR